MEATSLWPDPGSLHNSVWTYLTGLIDIIEWWKRMKCKETILKLVIIILYPSVCLKTLFVVNRIELCSEPPKLTFRIMTSYEQRPIFHCPIGGLYRQVELYLKIDFSSLDPSLNQSILWALFFSTGPRIIFFERKDTFIIVLGQGHCWQKIQSHE